MFEGDKNVSAASGAYPLATLDAKRNVEIGTDVFEAGTDSAIGASVHDCSVLCSLRDMFHFHAQPA
jgi:hypothetical protein